MSTDWSDTAATLRDLAEHYQQRATAAHPWWRFGQRRMQRTFRDWDLELSIKLNAIADEIADFTARYGHDAVPDAHREVHAVVQHIALAAGYMEATQ